MEKMVKSEKNGENQVCGQEGGQGWVIEVFLPLDNGGLKSTGAREDLRFFEFFEKKMANF